MALLAPALLLPSASASLPDSLSRVRERAGVRARALRRQQTEAETLLWKHLRSRQLLGLKFRRQHPIGPCFADFACIEIGLVIELDGGQHADEGAAAQDTARALCMAAAGFTTRRFWNHEVLQQTAAVLETIAHCASTLTPALSRTRERKLTPRSLP